MIRFERTKLELKYDSKLVQVFDDYLVKPDGDTVVYDLIHHKNHGGAGVLLVDENEYVYLIQIYRNSINDVNIEIPAGGYAYEGELGSLCAVREAEEETGLIPNKLFHVSNMVSSVGTYDEMTDIYIGTDLKEGRTNLDPDEYIELLHISVDEAIQMVFSGRINDSKTMVALFAYKEMKRQGHLQT